jgi:hypothetical protein
LVKEADDLEEPDLPEAGTVLGEEGAVAWWKSDTQRGRGFRDSQFRGTACNDARSAALGAH